LAAVVPTTTAAGLSELLGGVAQDRPPLYAALADRVRLLVTDGRLPVGCRLPPERELALALHVSRATVSAAYARLREQGWASAVQGSGTWTRLPAGPDLGAWLPSGDVPGVLDLAHAAPSAPPAVSSAYAAALADLPRLLPGNGYEPYGLPELRQRIADRFTRRGLPTTAEQVLVTSGALHATSLALGVLVGPGDRVLVEDPGYPHAHDTVRALGARTVPVRVSAQAPEAVARDVHRAAREAAPRAAYLVPDFSNPTGLLLDDEQRRRLAVGLEQCGVVTVVDETLVDLGLDATPGTPLAAVLPPGLAVTVGSLNKTVWGGLRLGWLRAEPGLVRRCAVALSHASLGLPVLEQLAACRLLDVVDELAQERRERLRRSRTALVGALRRELPDWQVPVPPGGLVLWCGLPRGSSSALTAVAERHGLRLVAGPRFGAGTAHDDRLRLPYVHDADVLDAAVGRLAAAWAEVTDGVPLRPASGSALDLVV
jgi:DNA-binding transcriptional MocR family regulator